MLCPAPDRDPTHGSAATSVRAHAGVRTSLTGLTTWAPCRRPVADACDTAPVSEPPDLSLVEHWPLLGLRLHCGNVRLRPVQERDLPRLAAMQPSDYEHDPSSEAFLGEDPVQHRRRLVYQGYWRSFGTWSPSSWCLDFAVEHEGTLVGVQSLEADDFLALRTVDSGSWLVQSARGHGVGIAMRTAVLSLAFDHLHALAAVTSARTDNGASLGVSRRVGYRDNGVSPEPFRARSSRTRTHAADGRGVAYFGGR